MMFERAQPTQEAGAYGRLLQRILPVAMILVLLLGISGGARLALSLGQPFPGFALLWRKELKMLTVGYLTPNYWSGIRAGMRLNDRILCIDGYHPKPDSAVYAIDPRYAGFVCSEGSWFYADLFRERYASQGSPSVTFLVDRDGVYTPISNVPLVSFTLGMLLEIFLPAFLLGVSLLVISWVVYHAGPSEMLNLIFSTYITIVAAQVMAIGYAQIFSDRFADARGIMILFSNPWLPLLGVVFFHLMSLFTDQRFFSALGRRICLPYYLISAFFSVLGVLILIIHEHPFSYTMTWPYIHFTALSLVFAIGWGLVVLGWTWYTTLSRRVRHQTGAILIGLLLTLISVLPYLIFFLTDASVVPQYTSSVPYLGLIMVAIYAYAILRYQLFKSKARILNLLLIMIFCAFSANLVYVLLQRSTEFLPVLIVALLTGTGLELHWRPLTFLNQLMHPEIHYYETIIHFTQQVDGAQKIEDLLPALYQAFKDDFDVECVNLWLLDQELPSAQQFCDGHNGSSVVVAESFRAFLSIQQYPARAGTPQAMCYQDALLLAAEDPTIALWIPLCEQGQAVGVLGLGPRWTGQVFEDQEIQIINMMARKIMLSILNMRYVERLRWMSQLIQQAEENERLKIAGELHDTILQFMLVLTYGLDSLKDAPEDLPAQIEHWQDRISAEAEALRTLLSHLRAPEVLGQQGLVPSLQHWIGRIYRNDTVMLETDFDPTVERILPLNVQVALYRVFREALHNAFKHAQANSVSARMWQCQGRVHILVQDNGQGFDVQATLRERTKGYSSLQDMRVYLANVGGELQIQSCSGKGTRVEGWVPISTALTGL